MKRLWLILPLLLVFSCEDKKDEDNERQEEAEVIVFLKTFGGSLLTLLVLFAKKEL